MRRTSKEIASVLYPRPTETGWPLPLRNESQAEYNRRCASMVRTYETKPPGAMNGPAKAKGRPQR